jgi:hypothetical protein
MPGFDKQITIHPAHSGWVVRIASGGSTQSFSCPTELVACRFVALLQGTLQRL